jgi:hypothetical protein
MIVLFGTLKNVFGCVIKIYLGVVRGSHGTSRILGDISKYLDANMNVSTLALKNCACVDQVQILYNGKQKTPHFGKLWFKWVVVGWVQSFQCFNDGL